LKNAGNLAWLVAELKVMVKVAPSPENTAEAKTGGDGGCLMLIDVK